MLRRRAVKRLLLFVLCIILFKLFLMREEGLALDSETSNKPQLISPQGRGGGGVKSIQHHNTKDITAGDAKTQLSQYLLGRPLSGTPGLTGNREKHKDPIDKTQLSQNSDILVSPKVQSDPMRNSLPLERSTVKSESARFVNSEIPPTWMRISDDVYTYSAFWDSREELQPTGPVVRVLGVLRYQQEHMKQKPGYMKSGFVKEECFNYSCLLWYTGQGYREGHLQAFVYEEGMKVFVGTYFLCYPDSPLLNSTKEEKVKSSVNKVPYAVSLVPHDAANITHKLIYIRNIEETKESIRNESSSVCVRPLFGPYSDLRAMAQFVSYYTTVLGVTHFYFYDHAIDPRIRYFFNLLTRTGVNMRVLPWNVPTSIWEELWDVGSLTALNDCIYRSAGMHNYVAVVDLDEFIVPRTQISSLGELYQNVLKHKHGEEGDTALILNAFYCTDFKKSPIKLDNKTFPIFQLTQREVRLWPPEIRSKMVVVPKSVVAVGHHMVHQFLKGEFKNRASPKHISVLHHYRSCTGLHAGRFGQGASVLDQGSVKDAAMLKYKKKILTSPVVALYKKILVGES